MGFKRGISSAAKHPLLVVRAHSARPTHRGHPDMNWCHREPTLNGILSDSIVRAVMEADGVNRHELEVMLRRVAQRLRLRSGDPSEDLAALVRCRVQIS